MTPDSNNYFELFSLPVGYQVEQSALYREYKNLQARFHPDRFMQADDKSRLQALQQTSLINDAYQTLKSPLKRAAYLLKLHGTDPEEHNQSHLDEGFLFSQMQLRETLESYIEDENPDGLESLKKSVSVDIGELQVAFETGYNAGEFMQAKSLYNKLQFLYKLLDEIDAAEEKLLDY